MSRTLVWFSCGATSAVAAKLALEHCQNVEILYCDTLKYEHPDNARFISDCEKWYGQPIKILRSEKYIDIFDVFDKTRWLVGHGIARCSIELKRNVRRAYQLPDDLHVFGMDADEDKRIERFRNENFELNLWFPLLDFHITKQGAIDKLLDAGIELPAMYRLGYKNNNCIGCVKGKMGYWNKIRVDFPEVFARMCSQERKMGATVISGMYLDELQPGRGRYDSEIDLECAVTCETQIQGRLFE